MRSSSFALCTISLFSLPVLAGAQDPGRKVAPVPPSAADVKTPAPLVLPRSAPAHETLPPGRDVPLPAKTGAATHGFLRGLDAHTIHFDEPGDGRVWAAADGYKASFGVEGATYFPFLGARAPRNFPVRFELRSVRAGADEIAFERNVAPTRQGNRVVFDRGTVDEVYDLSPTSIEQSFVLEVPLDGEIVIEVAVESELARSSDEHGLVLASAHGSVRYGRAFALDARVGRTQLESLWHADAIRIAVPAERAATAAWPLVIDPVIITFDVDGDPTLGDTAPDVAYDASTGYWMAVYERTFSASDHDVFFRVFESDGGGIAMGSIDITTAYWAEPKVANNNIANQYLCVAAVGDPALGARIIRGRTRGALGTLGTPFTISGGETGEKHSPDVGGDPLLEGPTYYCVVWQRDYAPNDTDIHARLVTDASTLLGSTIGLSNSGGTLDYSPSISESDGAGPADLQNWNVGWHRNIAFGDNDPYVAQIHWNGTVTMPPLAIDSTSADMHSVSVSTSTADSQRNYLVVVQRQISASNPNTRGYLLRGSMLIDSADLTQLSGAPTGEDQWYPSVDCDGSAFVVADQETYNGTLDYDVYVSTVHVVGNQLTVGEGHVNLAASTSAERLVDVACAQSSGGPSRESMIVWCDMSGTPSGDIEGAHYDASPFAQFCDPDTDGVVACPCNNPPSSAHRGCNNSANTGGAFLWATGNVSPDTVVLHANSTTPNALCLFVQGSLFNPSGALFGDGVRCVAGAQQRLGLKTAVGGSSAFPGPGDPSITARSAALGFPISAGQKRFYFVYYRDPAFYACNIATFNATNALQVQW
jgi:hypothetical protein